jgi:hypothetical protein
VDGDDELASWGGREDLCLSVYDGLQEVVWLFPCNTQDLFLRSNSWGKTIVGEEVGDCMYWFFGIIGVLSISVRCKEVHRIYSIHREG